MAHERLSDFRYVNITLGAWLFVSAFLWPHTNLEMFNAAIVGAAIIVVATIGLRAPMFRFVNTALATWLFISDLVLAPQEWGTPVNGVLVAVTVFFFSLVGGYRRMPTAHGT